MFKLSCSFTYFGIEFFLWEDFFTDCHQILHLTLANSGEVFNFHTPLNSSENFLKDIKNANKKQKKNRGRELKWALLVFKALLYLKFTSNVTDLKRGSNTKQQKIIAPVPNLNNQVRVITKSA